MINQLVLEIYSKINEFLEGNKIINLMFALILTFSEGAQL